jgi:hypothetical protein
MATSSLENLMFRTIALAAILGAVALPALAATQVTVNVSGLDARAAHAVIFHAAQTACRTELAGDSSLLRSYEWSDCIHDAVSTAETKLATMRGLASR